MLYGDLNSCVKLNLSAWWNKSRADKNWLYYYYDETGRDTEIGLIKKTFVDLNI